MLQKQQRDSWSISFKDRIQWWQSSEVDTQLSEEKLNSQELVIDEDAVSGWLTPASLPPSHQPDSP